MAPVGHAEQNLKDVHCLAASKTQIPGVERNDNRGEGHEGGGLQCEAEFRPRFSLPGLEELGHVPKLIIS